MLQNRFGTDTQICALKKCEEIFNKWRRRHELYETFLRFGTFQLGTNVIYINPSPPPWLCFIEGRVRGCGYLNKNSTKKQLQCCEEWDLSVICCLKLRRLQVWGRQEFWACSAVWEKQWEGKHHPLWGNYWNYQGPAPVPANDNPSHLPCWSPRNWYTQSHLPGTCPQ